MNCANHPDRERVSFCQNCGKPLCSECTRPIGAAVFCEPCLAARLAAADSASQGTPYGNVNVPPTNGPAIPPGGSAASNPVVAGALGFIPGVGAMYNGQYAKGIVHLIIFAVLVSLSDNNGLFGLFVAGWVIYQVIEAYHTAQARRDGMPLPNPFGLNDIGERFGMGKSWTAPRATPAEPPAGMPYAANPPYTPPAPVWGAPTDSYGYAVPPVPPNAYTPPFTDSYNAPTAEPFSRQTGRFPTGAVILIGLGLVFFLGSTGMFAHFPIQRLLPFFLIALGVWIFVRKMTGSGLGIGDDGSPGYRMRLFRALRSSVWVTLVGVLFLLDSFNILSWGHSWPLFIIIAGLMTFFERSAQNNAPPTAAYAYPAPGSYPPPAPSATPVSSTEIVPSAPRNEEGR